MCLCEYILSLSQQGGLTSGCSTADLLMVWYVEAKRVMVNLSHQHICIQQRVGVLSHIYLAVLSSLVSWTEVCV